MSGWIDPLGVHALYRRLQRDSARLQELIDITTRLHPAGRRLARYRARLAEKGRMVAALQAVVRPGIELQPYKALVNAGHKSRAERLRAGDLTPPAPRPI